ncbi:DUF2171 domain-containing protein [Novacetimonas maltaceti]|uniref:DUF2171 domain-containing protein n=1 Tax=Novacetimonas maltaceti TaxID=1203393 RepID=A0A2S3VZL0_9PROT|nr:DUF2171 domain-containing protein [Novacetimonas maltaceti]POF62036.1 hypothetical protein KMAL_23170 [Novacetimonas maltaceti]PYD60498.1 DUF2171 domain-containing protein [Novacetimonas maltaceti]
MAEVTQEMIGRDVMASAGGRVGTLTAVPGDGTIQVTVDGPAESMFEIPAAWVASTENNRLVLNHTIEDVQSYTPAH